MSNLEKPALAFTYSRSATSYVTNFFLSLLVIVYSLFLLNRNDTQWSFYATIFASVCLISLMIGGLKWGRVLLVGARVFKHMQTPVRLWQAWQRAILMRTGLLLIVVFCATTTLELSHQSLFPTTALLGMVSLSLAGGFCLPLIFNNYLNKRCYCLLFGFASFLTYIIFFMGISQWINASWAWHLIAILAWPILAIGVLLYWKKPPVQKGKALFLQVKEFGIISDLRHFYFRFTNLGSINARQKKDALAASDKLLKNMGLFWFLFISPMLVVDWQAAVTLPHLIFLLMIAAFSSSYIVVKDLHWRFLLLPKHFQQGRIAYHLLVSSVMYYSFWALILFLLLYGLKISIATPLTYQRTASPSLFSIATLIIELLSAFCVGLLIRGSKKPGRSFFYLFLTCLVTAAGIASYFYLHKQDPIKTALFSMDLSYLSGVVVIGICALIYANQLWTRERVLAYL